MPERVGTGDLDRVAAWMQRLAVPETQAPRVVGDRGATTTRDEAVVPVEHPDPCAADRRAERPDASVDSARADPGSAEDDYRVRGEGHRAGRDVAGRVLASEVRVCRVFLVQMWRSEIDGEVQAPGSVRSERFGPTRGGDDVDRAQAAIKRCCDDAGGAGARQRQPLGAGSRRSWVADGPASTHSITRRSSCLERACA